MRIMIMNKNDYDVNCWFVFVTVESVAGKRVVITGASAGIGEQLAYHYARLGAKILVTSRRESALKQVGDS